MQDMGLHDEREIWKFGEIKNFKNEVETHGQHILMLRLNNGGEYTSVAFTNFCQAHDIWHQFIAPYTF